MKDIINGFREWNMKMNKAEKTIKMYNDYIVNFVDEYQITIENINQLEDKEFAKRFIDDELAKGLKPGSINKHKNILSTFSNFLVFQDLIETNKFKEISNIKNDKKEIDIYTTDETERIYNYMDNKIKENNFQRHIDKDVYFTNYVAIKLMNSCALRIDELCSIQMNDLNMETRRLNIRGKGGHGKVTRFNKLNKETFELVNKYLEIRNEINIKNGNEQYLFISAISKAKITDASIRKFIKKILDELDIVTSSPCHAFRHQRATELIAKGADVKAVSLFLGHSSEKVTEQYYIHQDEEVMEDLCEL